MSRYFPGHGFCVCFKCVSSGKAAGMTAVSWPVGSAVRGGIQACLLLQLLHQPGGNTVAAVVPAGREVVFYWVTLWLLPEKDKHVCGSC